MAQIKVSRTTLYYSRTDDSWYGWWADGAPATIPAARMEAAFLELFRAYQQQGMNPVAAGRQARGDVHSMTYWNTRAVAAGPMRKIRDRWSGWACGLRATRTNLPPWALPALMALWWVIGAAAR